MHTAKMVDVIAKDKHGKIILKPMRWGLIPASFMGSAGDWGASTTHARLETVATTPAFQNAWARKRRVIFPLEHYYEKARLNQDLLGKKAKAERVAIKRVDDKPMASAGIYDFAQLFDGPTLSAAMLTREPGRRMLDIHDREPVILEPEDWQAWLDGSDALNLNAPWPDDAFEVVPAAMVKRRVSN